MELLSCGAWPQLLSLETQSGDALRRSEDYLCRRGHHVEPWRVTEAEHHPGERSHPQFAAADGAEQGVFQHPVESLHNSVGLGVVGCRGADVDALPGEGHSPRLRGELSTSVGCQGEVDAELRDPGLQERPHDSVRSRVHDRDSFRPAGSSVDHRQKVLEAPVGGEGAHDVDVDVDEAFLRLGGWAGWSESRSCWARKPGIV